MTNGRNNRKVHDDTRFRTWRLHRHASSPFFSSSSPTHISRHLHVELGPRSPPALALAWPDTFFAAVLPSPLVLAVLHVAMCMHEKIRLQRLSSANTHPSRDACAVDCANSAAFMRLRLRPCTLLPMTSPLHLAAHLSAYQLDYCHLDGHPSLIAVVRVWKRPRRCAELVLQTKADLSPSLSLSQCWTEPLSPFPLNAIYHHFFIAATGWAATPGWAFR